MRIPCAVLALAACGGGGTPRVEIGALPERVTNGQLAGPLCTPTGCTCRTGDEDAGFPDPGKKRYEIKVGPSPQEAWVTMPGRTLYKSSQVPTACFYVDIAPGEHPVQLRASDPNGVVGVLEVKELGTRTKSWYDTFSFSCGYGGTCSLDQLDDIKDSYRAVKRNLHDKCGSTKIKQIAIENGKSPDRSHPNELVVAFTLDIYKFDPWKAHGDDTCGEKGGAPPAGYDDERTLDGGGAEGQRGSSDNEDPFAEPEATP